MQKIVFGEMEILKTEGSEEFAITMHDPLRINMLVKEKTTKCGLKVWTTNLKHYFVSGIENIIKLDKMSC